MQQPPKQPNPCKRLGVVHNHHPEYDDLKAQVYNLILRGATSSNLYAMMEVGELGKYALRMTQKRRKSMIADVRKQIKDDYAAEHTELRATALARLYDLYNECIEIGDRGNAVQCLKEINKMCGLYEPEKIDMRVAAEVVNVDFNFGKEKNNES